MARNVLIVDDSPTMRNMLKVAMQQEEFDISTAQDGEKAFQVAENQSFDLIITDINMPNVDGIELIRQLRASEKHKFTPILVVTTEGGDEMKQAGKAAGATGWIVKPFQPEALSRAVRKICNIDA